MAIDVIARALASKQSSETSFVNSVNGKTGDVVLNYHDVGATTSVIINALSNTTVNGYSVPKLTDEQVINAYNSVVAGKEVVISDKNGDMHFKVTQADVISDNEVFISFVYFDTMILTYITGEEIEYKTIDLSIFPGYDKTQTQTLKNINGIITWVTD